MWVVGSAYCSFDFDLQLTEILVILYDGDLNGDDVVNVADVLRVQRIILGLVPATQNDLDHGDVYPPDAPDGVIDISDLLLILKMALQ